MRKVKLYCAFVLAMFLAFTILSAEAGVHTKQVFNQEQVGSQLKLEVKEGYKIDDAEYIGAVASKSKIGSGLGFGSEGVVLLGGLALLFGVFKRNPLLTVFGILAVALIISGNYGEAAGVMLAKIPAAAIKVNKEGLDKDSEEYQFLEKFEKRVKIEGGASGEDIDKVVANAVAEGIKEFKGLSADKINELLDEKTGSMAILKRHGETITALQGKLSQAEQMGKGAKPLIKKGVQDFIDNKGVEKLQDIYSEGRGQVFLFGSDKVEKAVGNVTTGSVTTDTGGNAILDTINADEIASFNLRMPRIEDFATVTRTAKPVFVYTDYIPKEGDAGFTAEAAAKSQMDFKLETRHETPRKATGYEIMSQESIDDVPRLQSEATTLLLKKYLLKRQNGILFGDTTNNTPNGVINQAPTWDATSWDSDVNPVLDPNTYDVITALANQIYTSHNYTDEESYFPNVAFMNPSDLAGLKLKKNEFGMYLFPQLVLNGDNKLDGFGIVSLRDITAGKILMGDFTKLRIINYIDYYVKMGWVNDQFIKNLFTILGEGRFYTLIKNLDKKAFVYADIADVMATLKGNP